jgi:hypothetical protein
MQEIKPLKPRLSKSHLSNPNKVDIHIDLSLADIGDIEPEATYVGRILSARLIRPSDVERAAKIDITIEIVDLDGKRIGVIHDYLYLSDRSMPRLKKFLMAAHIVNEKTYRAYELDVPAIAGSLIGITTRESTDRVNDDGDPIIEIASYLDPETAAQEYTDSIGEGQD